MLDTSTTNNNNNNCNHDLREWNTIKSRAYYYSDVFCTKCNNEFEHIIAYGTAGGTVTQWVSELKKKKAKEENDRTRR
jgi:hypothetical protein